MLVNLRFFLNIFYCLLIVIASGVDTVAVASEQQKQSVEELGLEELLNQRIELYRESDTASGVVESIKDAPATMVLLTKEEIQKRGYLNLIDILSDLPGFDTIITNGSIPSISYQRGYRTPWTQRTLFLINGKVDNNLWNQAALISKQYPVQGIERIEVLYGPAGALYGPNAFLGVINIITKDPLSLKKNEKYFNSQVILGDFNTRALDFSLGGAFSALNVVISGRVYQSGEADINDYADWGFFKNSLLNDSNIWGKAIATSDFNNDGITDKFDGKVIGKFSDDSDDHSFIGEVGYENWKLGTILWRTKESYGPYYALDKAQSNTNWINESKQYYLEYSGELSGIKVTNELLYRESKVYGYWVENFDGWVSLSNWNSYNNAWRFRQQYHYQYNEKLQLSGGIKYERKGLTKAYTTCGYWTSSLCPAEGGMSTGEGIRSGEHRDTINLPSSINRSDFNPDSRIDTTDKGIFIQGIYNTDKWRINGGIRWDNNSEYGSVVNPRGAVIYHYSPITTYKLIYGEAFQEPSPKDLYGGWSGRQANPDLKPEKMKSLEFVAIHQTDNFLHDLSLYLSKFDDVIVNGASGNIGGREVFGFEYRGKVNLQNPFFQSEDITAQLYYTFSDVQADYQFIQAVNDDGSDGWVKKRDDLGDIAPHKISTIIDVPFSEHWAINFQINWVSDRQLYSENPLRAEYNLNRAEQDDREAKSYVVVDMHLGYQSNAFNSGVRIENLFGKKYYHPGAESAGSGDDFTRASQGFSNSLIPQVSKPVVMAYLTFKF